MIVKVLYCIFLGLLVAMFVGWAMASWYPTPEWETEYPGIERYDTVPYQSEPTSEELKYLTPEEREERIAKYEEYRKTHAEWEAKNRELEKEFSKKVEIQGRNVAMISLLIAVLVTSVSLMYGHKLPVIGEGLLLGGLFTLIYSIGWSIARAPKTAVITVGIGLIVTIVLGFKKFASKPKSPS